MIYLLAYRTQRGDVLSINSKGQLRGSEDLQEAIKMLPQYNYYNQEDTELRKNSSVCDFNFLTYIISVGSLEDTFKAIESRKSERCYKTMMHFATVLDHVSYLLKPISLPKTK